MYAYTEVISVSSV